MTRPPLAGFNHNIRYKNRVYHLQSEDSGVERPHIYSHLFSQGMIIATAHLEYAELAAHEGHEKQVAELMREQHRGLLKRLFHGELDEIIVMRLGCLDPNAPVDQAAAATRRKVQRYRHQLRYAGRVYSIQTDFYATVVTDVYQDWVLIDAQITDCRGKALPGSDAVRKIAQDQHRCMLQKLRDGHLDANIISRLGSLIAQDGDGAQSQQNAARNTVAPGDGEAQSGTDGSEEEESAGVRHADDTNSPRQVLAATVATLLRKPLPPTPTPVPAASQP